MKKTRVLRREKKKSEAEWRGKRVRCGHGDSPKDLTQ